MRTPLLVLLCSLQWGCGPEPAGGAAADDGPMSPVGPVAAEQQREGDPRKGYAALVNNGYVSCGIPYSAYARVFDPAPAESRLPGREGRNVELPYLMTAFTTSSGVEVVAPNCLSCHAGRINGQLVVGLGNAAGDFTQDPSGPVLLAGGLVTDPKERAEWQKLSDRVAAIAPFTMLKTVGLSAADNLAAVLFAHRDAKTLAWSDEPLLELPPTEVVPVDVPPWWRMKKKHAMFYNGSGRGDHARIMMTASTLCTDSVAEARAIDGYFADVRAYISSIEPPAYPFPIEQAQLPAGQVLFIAHCARCHGTYGPQGVYPNLIVGLDEVGTDPLLAVGAAQFATRFVRWFNESFYGERSRLAPARGYVAPPLDGIWATAPFLHNGSVPSLEALLDSKKRPVYWTRSFDSRDYDQQALGWRFTALQRGQADEPDASKRRLVYDTTLPGYASGGHTFGDGLAAEDRAALLQYLKTL